MMKSVRLAGDGGSYRVTAIAGMYKVTPADPDDAPDAEIAEMRIVTAMMTGYSPAMGEGLAFAARVAADYLGSRVVFVPMGAGELERGRDLKNLSKYKSATGVKVDDATLKAIGESGTAAERAFCPGVSPPDNSCSPANKGDGRVSPAKAGNGSLVSAARERHKKDLERLRKKLIEAPERAERKYRKLWEKEFALRAKCDAAAQLRYDLHVEAQGAGTAEDLDAALKKYLESERELDALVKETEEAFQERVAASKARDEESLARKILATEVAAVDKEDGLTLRERRAAADAIKERHTVEMLVDEFHAKKTQFDPAGVVHEGLRSPEFARDPFATENRENALGYLRDTVNNSIHRDGITAPIVYEQVVRASAAGVVMVDDYTEYSNPNNVDAEMLTSMKMTGVQTWEVVGRVMLNPRDSVSTIIHEYGHQIEHGNAEVARLCDDFLRSRVGRETPVSLRQAFGDHYDADEIGSPDDFARTFQRVYGLDGGQEAMHSFAHYAGKRYPQQFSSPRISEDGIKRYSLGNTEVLSMGMELMRVSPSRFAQADPEWFDLVAGITTGRILDETRQKRRTGK